jgi:hypothetical protein
MLFWINTAVVVSSCFLAFSMTVWADEYEVYAEIAEVTIDTAITIRGALNLICNGDGLHGGDKANFRPLRPSEMGVCIKLASTHCSYL